MFTTWLWFQSKWFADCLSLCVRMAALCVALCANSCFGRRPLEVGRTFTLTTQRVFSFGLRFQFQDGALKWEKTSSAERSVCSVRPSWLRTRPYASPGHHDSPDGGQPYGWRVEGEFGLKGSSYVFCVYNSKATVAFHLAQCYMYLVFVQFCNDNR